MISLAVVYFIGVIGSTLVLLNRQFNLWPRAQRPMPEGSLLFDNVDKDDNLILQALYIDPDTGEAELRVYRHRSPRIPLDIRGRVAKKMQFRRQKQRAAEFVLQQKARADKFNSDALNQWPFIDRC